MKKADSYNNVHLQDWARSLLANPITKLPAAISDFKTSNGVIDARVFLKNSHGWSDWSDGQVSYEAFEADLNIEKNYSLGIEIDKPIYARFPLSGTVLDIGGAMGIIREYLSSDVNYISVDPNINIPTNIEKYKNGPYRCLSEPLNFVLALAEFLPFKSESFDYVHMLSMLDHVQIPDLVLLEASRVLKSNGKLLIGVHLHGGKLGKRTFKRYVKDLAISVLGWAGVEKFRDDHTWHPNYKSLVKLIESNNFIVASEYWQPYWKDQVVWIQAVKR